MTREEIIKELEEDKALYMPEEWIEILDRDTPDGRLITALDMAIEALEQQPCEDAISRQAVLDYAKDTCLDLDSFDDTEVFCDEIKLLPSVTPQPCSNCCNGNQNEKAKLCQKSYLAGMEHKQEPKWIPVSEKMPGHYEVVLACCNDDFVTLASFSYKEDRWECLTNMSSDTHFPENEEVIAWMPLPLPYKSESENANADSD